MHRLELRVPPLVLVVIFAAAMAAVARFVPVATVQVPARLLIAVSLAAAGALVVVAGVIAFRQQKTTINPMAPEQSSSLVSTGIYRFSRNPMYLGFLLALLAWAAYLQNWAAAALLVGFVTYMNKFQIQPEERALSARFGPRFSEYARTVRRWV